MSRSVDRSTSGRALGGRLDALLQVEQRLEGRVAAAEQEARAQVAAARARAGEGQAAAEASLASALAAEEAADRATHQQRLSELSDQTARERAALAVPDDVVERCARGVVARILGAP